MSRRTLVAVVAAIATALLAAGVAQSQGSATKLSGTVGPGFTIKLTKGGKKFSSLKAGKYSFAVTDKSSIHDFTLEQEKGGKFEKHLTTVPATGSKTVSVTLKKGKWKYYCSAHEGQMHGFFTVK
jgi:plastocyanin